MHIDHICHQISKQVDLCFGQPRFKHLAEFAKFPFLIPRIIHIVRVYLALSERPALIVAIT